MPAQTVPLNVTQNIVVPPLKNSISVVDAIPGAADYVQLTATTMTGPLVVPTHGNLITKLSALTTADSTMAGQITTLQGYVPTAWANLTLSNGWVAFPGFQVPQYRRWGDLVELRGVLSGASKTSDTFTTMPLGHIPPIQEVSHCIAGVPEVIARVNILANGQVQLVGITGLTGLYVALNGIRFSRIA